MAFSPPSTHLLKFVLPTFFVLLITLFFLTFHRKESIVSAAYKEHGILWSGAQNNGIAGKKATYIKEAQEWEIDGSFDQRPLRGLCERTEWQPGLAFECLASYGGVGNVRNTVLTCVRYAIEAGATTLIVPQIRARDEDLIGLKNGKDLPFTYMFDEDHFISSLASTCPQIQIIPHLDDLSDIPSARKPTKLIPKDLGTDFRVFRVMNFASKWRAKFDGWIPKFGAPNGFSPAEPLVVSIPPPIFEFPTDYDSPEFIATFGRILRFNDHARRLAAIVLYAMNTKYNLDINPAKIGVPDAEKYYGAHLRTAIDATKAGFAPYEDQAASYLADAKKHKLSVIYLASGSAPDIVRFTGDAAVHNISTTTKKRLLEEKDEYKHALEEMQELSWDQQALIDYLVLLRCSAFGGTWASSFAWNIVFRRHVVVNNGIWVPSKAAESAKRDVGVRDEPGKVAYGDKINTIFGDDARGIWFELSMWP
ncbi:hypothetical protein BJ878DRAFT_69002 [Calycina marina]|uniref:Alternative oxidase n=1 Tax=Calycina marina TaxID=1763456 RepID=A0A9P8CF40_9HELO|nr:hypothetical protein BJ878DRAFT_69002 [Calycina marina]